MREYETTVVLQPTLTDADVKHWTERLEAHVKRHNGHIFRSQNLGKKNLAYRIKKQSKGFYVYLDYSADNTCVAELEKGLRLDEQVLRYLTVKLDEDVNVEQRIAYLKKQSEELAAAMAAKVATPPPPVEKDIETEEEGRVYA